MSSKNLINSGEKYKHIPPDITVLDGKYIPGKDICSDWVRPSDWTVYTEPTSAEEKLVGLYAVWEGNNNYISLSASGNYMVMWGDGVIEYFTANTQANHWYNFNSISASSSRGYKMVVVTVVPQSGHILKAINLHLKPSGGGGSNATSYPTNGWLDISISGPNLDSLIVAASAYNSLTFTNRFSYLEQFKLINSKLNSFNGVLYNCASLKSVPIITLNPNPTPIVRDVPYSFGITTNAVTANNHGLQTNDIVYFKTMSLSIAAPVICTTAGNEYYVINPTTNTFQLSTTPNGPAITPTSATTGTYNAGGHSLYGAFSYTKITSITNSNIDTSKVVNWYQAFQSCMNLKSVNLNFSSMWVASSIFSNCASLTDVSTINSTFPLYMQQAFSACQSLIKAPMIYTPAISGSHFYQTFQNCYNLKYIPSYNLSSGNTSYMFFNDYSLRYVPKLNFNGPGASAQSNMFQNCTALDKVEPLDMPYSTTMLYMFSGCFGLKEAPMITFPSTASGIWCMTDYAFQNCYSLKKVPDYDYSSVKSASYMFSGAGLTKIGNMNLTGIPATGTGATYILQNCPQLEEVGDIYVPNSSNLSYFFYGCSKLLKVGKITSSSVSAGNMYTNYLGMFSGCTSLTKVPEFNSYTFTQFPQGVSVGSMFYNCNSLSVGVPFDLSNCISASSLYMMCSSLTNPEISGCKVSIDFNGGNKMGKTDMESFCVYGLGPATGSPTLNIGQSAAVSAYVNTAGTGTINSTTVRVSSVVGIGIGDLVFSSYITSPTATASFTDSGDLVTHTSHNLSEGTKIAFRSITSTTGIYINTVYYVKYVSSNTFQLAASLGGPALPLTTNGSGTYVVPAYVSSVSSPYVYLTAPAMATFSGYAVNFYKTDFGLAILKGFTVSA